MKLRRRRPNETAQRGFLLGFPLFFGPVFALPLFLDPYGWARRFRWAEEPETDVGRYFGRCLGALAVGSCAGAAVAARNPSEHRLLFSVIEVQGWLLAAVHARGLLERSQPPIEHAEIALYAGAAIAARQLRPG